MIQRHFWLKQIEKYWQERSILWLSGVRRVGKTFLCQSLPRAEYFDCELPRVRRMMEDPEDFLNNLKGQRIILDEIHRLGNPSELLKIAADHYPKTKIIATGSSTLSASVKFEDTLAGRKRELWLTPMMTEDLSDFHLKDLSYRFLRGGLPPFFLSASVPERDYQEWVDAYWAKDIQELFRLERRYSFQKFMELLIIHSGGIFEATKFSQKCEVSRTTITNYLKILEATLVMHIIRPFNSHRPTEIVSAPKVYAFDTGFVCYHRGIDKLRQDDMGFLWEHFVLNEIFARLQNRNVYYWRDKAGHEVDFVLSRRGQSLTAIECKWKAEEFDASNLAIFSNHYPKADFVVIAHDVDKNFQRKYGNIKVDFVSLSSFSQQIS